MIKIKDKTRVLSRHQILNKNETLNDILLSNVIDTESIAFNKLFAIDSEDRHELLYLLTPDIMEKMICFTESDPFRVHYIFSNNALYLHV